MQSFKQTNNYQWQNYKQMELIPDAVPNPSTKASTFKFGLGFAWQLLVSLLVDELVDPEQQVEYLERCWANNALDREDKSPTRSLQRLWVLMN